MNDILHLLALEYFLTGVEISDTGDLERGGAILQVALTLAEAAQDNDSGDDELDALVRSIVSFIWNTRNLQDQSVDAAVQYVDETLPAFMAQIIDYMEHKV